MSNINALVVNHFKIFMLAVGILMVGFINISPLKQEAINSQISQLEREVASLNTEELKLTLLINQDENTLLLIKTDNQDLKVKLNQNRRDLDKARESLSKTSDKLYEVKNSFQARLIMPRMIFMQLGFFLMFTLALKKDEEDLGMFYFSIAIFSIGAVMLFL